MAAQKPIVVISAVNLTEGRTRLSILQDAVNAFVAYFISEYRLVLLVHDKKLLDINQDEVEILEYRYPKKSWFLRIWFEYVHCYFISKKVKPHIWFALHDITPNVCCANTMVYCHNPAPFYKLSLREAWIEKSLIFFNFFYGLFYRINIRSNKYVIVQQQWIREEFERRYKIKNIIVSYPDVHVDSSICKDHSATKKRFCFVYPSLPRVFKNFETVLKSVEMLQQKHSDFEVIFTFDGTENKYASELVKKYSHLSSTKFIGVQKREDLLQLYNNASCLIFASKMETWGLPITEMKLFNKPMLLSNCEYAKETVGDYDKACFFEVDNALQLCELMLRAINNSLEFNFYKTVQPQQPFANNWRELYQFILYKQQLKKAHVSADMFNSPI